MADENVRPFFGLPPKKGIRMEEEEIEGPLFTSTPRVFRPASNEGVSSDEESPSDEETSFEEETATDAVTQAPGNDPLAALYMRILAEQASIRSSLMSSEINEKDKLNLLTKHMEINQLFFKEITAAARPSTRRTTENVARNILIFAGVTLIILALLNVFADLPTDITLAFLGTTLGGTIATVAQKLGKMQ